MTGADGCFYVFKAQSVLLSRHPKLASKATWKAAEAAIQTYGGFAFAREYNIERKRREAQLYQVAPISTNMVLSYLAQRVLGLSRSF